MRKLLSISIVIAAGFNICCGDESSVGDEAAKTPPASGIVYMNPRVYNVDYSFELVPDPNRIDRAKDLKLWIPVPREWHSQKAVKIISVQPPPHAEFEDPDYGNRMLFWDFGQEAEKPCYRVSIKYRLEQYGVYADIDPNKVGTYDRSSGEYTLYTRSTHTISITPEIMELARQAIGDEKNPYLQAKRICRFVKNRMRYKVLDYERGRGIQCLLDYPVKNHQKDQEYYEGSCTQYTALFVALCRAVGIPARSVYGFTGWRPWIVKQPSKPLYRVETKLSPDGLAGIQHFGNMYPHMWGEFLLPDYGWIPVDAQTDKFGRIGNARIITCIGRDIEIGPHAPQEQDDGYGSQWVALRDGRADYLFSAVWNIGKIQHAKVTVLHRSKLFRPVPYYFCVIVASVLSCIAGGLAGSIGFGKFKRYAVAGLVNAAPLVGLALAVAFVRGEKQSRYSKVRVVLVFLAFSVFLFWLTLSPTMVKTGLVSGRPWERFSLAVICVLSTLVSWLLVGFLCKRSWIRNRVIRILSKIVLFPVFWTSTAFLCFLLVGHLRM